MFAPIITILFLVCTQVGRAEEAFFIDPDTHFKGSELIEEERGKKEFHPKNTLGMVVTPEDYRALAKRLSIQATLVVEAVDQDRLQFNDWVHAQAESDLVCGYVARADLTTDDFLRHHERYLETGNLNGYRFRKGELGSYLDDKAARGHLSRL